MDELPGAPAPLGASWDGAGTNFAIWSEHATRVELCLFDRPDRLSESRRVPLLCKTDGVWHIYLRGVRPGHIYGYRVHGPWNPIDGERFNPAKVLLDPYARAFGRRPTWHPSLFGYELDHGDEGPANASDTAAVAPLGLVFDPAYDWEDDKFPATPLAETVIYETHVKGFTARHPEIAPWLRGTYLGLASPPAIAHLRDLGVTAVELLPIHGHFDEWALHTSGRTNYWGYNTLAFFAPDPRFAVSHAPGAVVHEFRTMVKALHRAGIEVILDVVFNHTAEGDHLGPHLSMRGIDNQMYYRLEPSRRSRYENFSGCGNTLDMRAPAVRQLLMDSLHYWATDLHVDGFRFDLASALTPHREDEHSAHELFSAMRADPELAHVKLIAEPWDAAGVQHLGRMPSGWGEWNGRYRDAARRFWKGDAEMLPELATRVAGSSDLYEFSKRTPQASINFVSSHDGFTLADLVSYDTKHNEANGEGNRDGEWNNASWNMGVEGPTSDPAIREARARQRRNLLLTLLLSLGVPMLSGGDERGRTQRGNNNAYSLDDPSVWTPWEPGVEADGLMAFTRQLIALRRRTPAFARSSFLHGHAAGSTPDVQWLKTDGSEMSGADWNNGSARTLIARFAATSMHDTDVLVILHAAADDVAIILPGLDGESRWRQQLDTADPPGTSAEAGGGATWRIPGRSACVFAATPVTSAQAER